jgi:hypothetical protein
MAQDHRNDEGSYDEHQLQDHEKTRSGFSGTIQVGGMWMEEKSQLKVSDKNKRLDRQGPPEESEREIILMPLFELNYNFESGSKVYLGIPFEDDPRPTAGYKQGLENFGSFDISAFYSLPEKVWKDPYLTNVDRQKTGKNSYGGKIEHENEFFAVDYELELIDIEKDISGQRMKDLKRDGRVHRLGVEAEIHIGNGLMLEPGIGYARAEFEGRSNRYTGYQGGLSLAKMWASFMLHMRVEGGLNAFDASHPIFDKTREDKVYEAIGYVSWLNPLGYQNFFLNLGGGYEKNDSNIDFYDSEGSFMFMTVGYQFGAAGCDDDDD